MMKASWLLLKPFENAKNLYQYPPSEKLDIKSSVLFVYVMGQVYFLQS